MGEIYPEIDNDGYYQDVDDARYEDDDDELEIAENIKKECRIPIRITPERYATIVQNPFTKSGRRNFCKELNKIHDEARKKYNLDVKIGTYADLPTGKIFCQCRNCGGGFIAKVADRKRGWARFCSKSCKAQQH